MRFDEGLIAGISFECNGSELSEAGQATAEEAIFDAIVVVFACSRVEVDDLESWE